MDTAILIWLYLSAADFLQSLGKALLAAAILSAAGFGFCGLFALLDEDMDVVRRLRPYVKWWCGAVVAGLLFVSIVPTKTDLKYIVGGALVWEGVKTAGDLEGIDRLPQNLLDALNYFLEEVSDEEEVET